MEQNLPERRRIVVDGSNIATEGRTLPSLAQLDEAIRAFLEEYRGFTTSDVTVVVDASFGHRIDPSEVSAFDQAVEHGEMITPPAGAVGRGDGFILRIAEKSGALVLSNDSFQEFHAERPWLFEPGRLIGGKPVPGVGWIFTPRTPVRGARSRSVTAKSETGTGVRPGARHGHRGRRPASAEGGVVPEVTRITGQGADGAGATEATQSADASEAMEASLGRRRPAGTKPTKAAKATKASQDHQGGKGHQSGKGHQGDQSHQGHQGGQSRQGDQGGESRQDDQGGQSRQGDQGGQGHQGRPRRPRPRRRHGHQGHQDDQSDQDDQGGSANQGDQGDQGDVNRASTSDQATKASRAPGTGTPAVRVGTPQPVAPDHGQPVRCDEASTTR